MFESRGFNFFMAFVCYQMLVTAFYFQYVENMPPCPLCIFQRIGVLFVGLWFLIKAIHHPLSSSRCYLSYSLLIFASAILGGIVSAKHVYLQSLPAGEVPACGPALNYLVEMLPISEVISTVLSGDGECAKVSWRLLGISMPGWVLTFFVGIAGLMIKDIYRYFWPNKSVF